jgi:hypothetical protein
LNLCGNENKYKIGEPAIPGQGTVLPKPVHAVPGAQAN